MLRTQTAMPTDHGVASHRGGQGSTARREAQPLRQSQSTLQFLLPNKTLSAGERDIGLSTCSFRKRTPLARFSGVALCARTGQAVRAASACSVCADRAISASKRFSPCRSLRETHVQLATVPSLNCASGHASQNRGQCGSRPVPGKQGLLHTAQSIAAT